MSYHTASIIILVIVIAFFVLNVIGRIYVWFFEKDFSFDGCGTQFLSVVIVAGVCFTCLETCYEDDIENEKQEQRKYMSPKELQDDAEIEFLDEYYDDKEQYDVR